MAPDTLATRLDAIVREFFGGKVNRAANYFGVPQPTFRRMVLGITQRPAANVLAGIAAKAGTTVEWLLGGDGPAPSGPSTELPLPRGPMTPEALDWMDLLRDLAETRAPLRELLVLPFATTLARVRLASQLGGHINRDTYKASLRAMSLEMRAWSTLMHGFVREFGAQGVAAALAANQQAARVGFNGFGTELLDQGVIDARLDTLFRVYCAGLEDAIRVDVDETKEPHVEPSGSHPPSPLRRVPKKPRPSAGRAPKQKKR